MTSKDARLTAVAFGGILSVALLCSSVIAMPVLLEQGTMSVYDTGGKLDPSLNGGFYIGGLEVSPDGRAVYVIAADAPPGELNIYARLIRSFGSGTAETYGRIRWLRYWTMANDLTYAKTVSAPEGRYYIAVMQGPPAPGIYGLSGASGMDVFANTGSNWTSGLTFDAAGENAFISTRGPEDGLSKVNIHWGSSTIIKVGLIPNVPEKFDDHVYTDDGHFIFASDAEHQLWRVESVGIITKLIDLDEIPALSPFIAGHGARLTIDPSSGDLFFAWGTGGTSIFRIDPDGSEASVVATGFEYLRDIDFGLSSSGPAGSYSLYASAVSPAGVGSIYELRLGWVIPEPTSVTLIILGLLGLLLMRDGMRRTP